MNENVKKQEALITFKAGSPQSGSLSLSWTVENALPLQAVNAMLIDSTNYSVSIVLPVENSGSVTVPNIPKQTYTVYLAVTDTENNSYISNSETVTVNADEEIGTVLKGDDELEIAVLMVHPGGGGLKIWSVCIYKSPLIYARLSIMKGGIQIQSINILTQRMNLSFQPAEIKSGDTLVLGIIIEPGCYDILLDIRNEEGKKVKELKNVIL